MSEYIEIELDISNRINECEQKFRVGYVCENTNLKSVVKDDVEVFEFTAMLTDEFGQDYPFDSTALLMNQSVENLVREAVISHIEDSYCG